MSDHERGAYSPQTDAPLAFDARQSRGGGGGFPTTLVVSLVILVILVVAIVLFYRSGIRGAGQGPAAVGAPVAQIKTPAPAGAQPSDEAAGLQIYKTETQPPVTGGGAPLPAPTFSGPPEQPQARPTTPVQAQALPPPVPAQQASAQPQHPQASPAVAAATGATIPAKPAAKDEIGALLDKTPAAKPAKPVVVASNGPAVAKPVTAPAAKTPAAPAGNGTSVQIGAYSSEDLAAAGWNGLATQYPGDMSGKGQHFEAVPKDGKTLYRAAVTGFASHDAAMAFCAKLKAASHACFVR